MLPSRDNQTQHQHHQQHETTNSHRRRKRRRNASSVAHIDHEDQNQAQEEEQARGGGCSKRRKVDSHHDDSAKHHHGEREDEHSPHPSFWNSEVPSKVPLKRKVLKEFDRRVAQDKKIAAEGNDIETEDQRSSAERGQGAKDTRKFRVAKRALRPASTRRMLRSDARKLLDFAKNGGPDLKHLRGYAAVSAMSATASRNSNSKRSRRSGRSSSSTTTTGPYNSEFQQTLIDHGVFPPGFKPKGAFRAPRPQNFDELRQRLSRERSSLSPSAFPESAFEDFQDLSRQTSSESRAISSIIPVIAGSQDHQHAATEDNKHFKNMAPFAPGLTTACPDRYDGARPEQINRVVRRQLGQYIIPSRAHDLPAAPNFFQEFKGATGKGAIAERQVMYDNAHGARAMLHLQNFGHDNLKHDGNAYTLGCSYADGQLKLYATHPQQKSADGATEYYMTQLRAFAMTDTAESFREGAGAYRNARDLAKELRDGIIARANSMDTDTDPAATAQSNRTEDSTTASLSLANTSFTSDTSIDELALEHNGHAKRQRRRDARKTTSETDSLHPRRSLRRRRSTAAVA